eukprot:12105378-Alexandrium_andersonii.AAC.1
MATYYCKSKIFAKETGFAGPVCFQFRKAKNALCATCLRRVWDDPGAEIDYTEWCTEQKLRELNKLDDEYDDLPNRG